MFHVSASVCIDTPTGRVWAHLAPLENIEQWSEAVLAARCDGVVTRGVGAERTCDLAGGITITERWLEWDEGQSFVYEGAGIPLIARARNQWSVSAIGRQTLLTSEASVLVKGGPLGRLLDPLLAWQSRRMGARALAAFKYLVENGHPPAMPHSKLPKPSPAC